ncbi:hypothetical protein [Morganella morganii]|uniref:hypothetical protein n=1 Tax=Morganella morganii TaxID=582 RepID=UPI003BA3142E
MKKSEKHKNTILKSTLSRTADVGTNLALSFIPGGSAVYELAKLGVEQTRKYLNQRQEKRIAEFHANLLKPESESVTNDAYIEVVDYHTLLNACLQDIEDEKTELYATLARHAALRKSSPTDLRFFSISLSEMTFSCLEEMRVAYIASKFNLIPTEGGGRYEKSLSIEHSPSGLIYGRKMMEMRGFVDNSKLNLYGERFVQACYPSEKLLPRSIHMSEWRNAHSPLHILSYELDDPFVTQLFMHLASQLRTQGYKTTPLYSAVRRKSNSLLPIDASILLFRDKSERIMDNFQYLDVFLKKGCIAVQIGDTCPEILEPLREKFEMIINIDSTDPHTGATQIVNAVHSYDF